MTFASPEWQRRARRNRASSLMEVMLVLAILVVIAAVFSMASHELIVRAKTAKTKDDHRLLANALQSYRWDHPDFPSTDQGMEPLVATHLRDTLPRDPFAPQSMPYLFVRRPLADSEDELSGDNGEVNFIIASVGPNGKSDIMNFLYPPKEPEKINVGPPKTGQKSTAEGGPEEDKEDRKPKKLTMLDLMNLTYDPTNGAKSKGDIIKIQN